jgi:hypothetical protein
MGHGGSIHANARPDPKLNREHDLRLCCQRGSGPRSDGDDVAPDTFTVRKGCGRRRTWAGLGQ